jgi:predicted  nucleic acid-binding Zn-ribbon protein
MEDKPAQDLATRAFQKRALDELIGLRTEQRELRAEQTEFLAEQAKFQKDVVEVVQQLRAEVGQLRADVTEIQKQQSAMAEKIGAIDQSLTSLEQRVDERLNETRSIWEAVQIQIQRLGEKLDGVFLEFQELRTEIKLHGRRIAELERRMLN